MNYSQVQQPGWPRYLGPDDEILVTPHEFRPQSHWPAFCVDCGYIRAAVVHKPSEPEVPIQNHEYQASPHGADADEMPVCCVCGFPEEYPYHEPWDDPDITAPRGPLQYVMPGDPDARADYGRDDADYRHPDHYQQVPGIECWDVIKHFPTLRGFAIKHLWRAGAKGDILVDLRKAIEYTTKEIEWIEEQRAAADLD